MMNFDKEALLQQLKTPQDEAATGAVGDLAAGMKGGMGRGADVGPTSNTMPIRDRAPINDQVAAAPSPLPAPPSASPAATGPSGLADLAGAMRLPGGSLAQAMQTPPSTAPPGPMSQTPQLETGTPTTGKPGGVGMTGAPVAAAPIHQTFMGSPLDALQPKNIGQTLDPRNIGQALRPSNVGQALSPRNVFNPLLHPKRTFQSLNPLRLFR